jgi:hypothetical protein
LPSNWQANPRHEIVLLVCHNSMGKPKFSFSYFLFLVKT